jgi:RNA polymerase sigma factor (TIGR02999 family)
VRVAGEPLTRWLRAWQDAPDDPQAAEQVARGAYATLHAIAVGRLRHESSQAFSPTELLHEAWLRFDPHGDTICDRSHFFRLAATAMRRVLVDQARERLAAKRGGGDVRVTLSLADNDGVAAPGFGDGDLVDLDRALTRLAKEHARPAQAAILRGFAGLTLEEVAEAMQSSLATVKRDLAFARAWLAHALKERSDGG